MQMMKKRILSLLLCVAVLGTVAGCGKKPLPDDGEEMLEETAEETAEAEEEEIWQEPEAVSMEDNYRTWYEVFVYSFYDGNGDGIGDLKGLTEKLDYINDGNPGTTEDLGCNGIWLMPVMSSTTYHKYDVTDYCGIDPEYGTMEDFEDFMAACEEREIKVILDLVINHSSSQHPWFQEACSYLAELGDGEPDLNVCPYVDYYHFSREKKGGYAQVPGSDIWYYEAQFWDGMPDLNLYNEQLRGEIEQIVDFWLDKGVGGFRLDAAKEFETGANAANTEILAWFTDMVKSKKEDAYLVAEVWTDFNTYAGYYDSGIDSVFNFAFADNDGIIAKTVKGMIPASSYGSRLEEAEAVFAQHNPNYIDAPFYTNHDMGRSAGYYAGEESEAQTKLAGAMNLMMGGSAFIYYGEELGMKGSGKDENKRAPMYFSADASAEGMCKGPADMDTVKMKFGSYEEQKEDALSVYAYYKRAIYLRNLYPVIRKGRTENFGDFASGKIAAFSKSLENEKMYFFINISSEEAVLDLSGIPGISAISDALYTGEEKGSFENGTLTIPGYGLVLCRED